MFKTLSVNIIGLVYLYYLFPIWFISQTFNCTKVWEKKILLLENIFQRYVHITCMSLCEIGKQTTIEAIIKNCLFGIAAWGFPDLIENWLKKRWKVPNHMPFSVSFVFNKRKKHPKELLKTQPYNKNLTFITDTRCFVGFIFGILISI